MILHKLENDVKIEQLRQILALIVNAHLHNYMKGYQIILSLKVEITYRPVVGRHP